MKNRGKYRIENAAIAEVLKKEHKYLMNDSGNKLQNVRKITL